jgi:hypothetical protein
MGCALLVAAQVPGWRHVFDGLLDGCRLTHEPYATYLSCSLVTSSGVGSPATALASYPNYAPLVDWLDRYLTAVPGAHRRSLAVTALARMCMQTPILTQLTASWPEPITIGAIRALDVPDERLKYLLRDPGRLPAELVAAADDTVDAEFGAEPLAADCAGGVAALDDQFDAAWARKTLSLRLSPPGLLARVRP